MRNKQIGSLNFLSFTPPHLVIWSQTPHTPTPFENCIGIPPFPNGLYLSDTNAQSIVCNWLIKKVFLATQNF